MDNRPLGELRPIAGYTKGVIRARRLGRMPDYIGVLFWSEGMQLHVDLTDFGSYMGLGGKDQRHKWKLLRRASPVDIETFRAAVDAVCPDQGALL